MAVPGDWIEYRRGDRERLGWMMPSGDGFVVFDLLGRRISDELDWLDAEELLDRLGMGYLADPYELKLDGCQWLRVRLVEVSTDGIRVKKEDWGDVTASVREYTVSFPPADSLRVLISS
jgi:hypothetical protein